MGLVICGWVSYVIWLELTEDDKIAKYLICIIVMGITLSGRLWILVSWLIILINMNCSVDTVSSVNLQNSIISISIMGGSCSTNLLKYSVVFTITMHWPSIFTILSWAWYQVVMLKEWEQGFYPSEFIWVILSWAHSVCYAKPILKEVNIRVPNITW